MSYNSQYYGISGKGEAKAYLEYPVLGKRLQEITTAFLELSGKSAEDVFGCLDAMKVLSCMTLFNEVAEDDLFSCLIRGAKLDCAKKAQFYAVYTITVAIINTIYYKIISTLHNRIFK